jgi:hypothetical protein
MSRLRTVRRERQIILVNTHLYVILQIPSTPDFKPLLHAFSNKYPYEHFAKDKEAQSQRYRPSFRRDNRKKANDFF